jgi:hypothetical protein
MTFCRSLVLNEAILQNYLISGKNKKATPRLCLGRLFEPATGTKRNAAGGFFAKASIRHQ